MVDVAELIRRVEALERDGSAAALTRMEQRIGAVEQRIEAHNTVLGKALTILEETRLRVSAVETRLTEFQEDTARRLSKLEADIAGLRRDLPSIVAETMREVLKENG